MTDVDELDPEQGEDEHHVPADLLELYEVLEWTGAIQPPTMSKTIAPGIFVSRAAWGARRATGVTRLDNPQGTTLHYEGPHMGTFPHSSCATKVRAIQNFHMNQRGWTDIAYNMLACPHGYVFEGRGRDVRSAANGTNTGNSSSHAVCALIGDQDTVTNELKQGLCDARTWLMDGGTGSSTWGHRNWKATACPGDPLYAWHQSGWPRPSGTVPPVVPPVDAPESGKCSESHPILRIGATGRPVNHLQYFLILSGAKIPGDGDFGPMTRQAVVNHQIWLIQVRHEPIGTADGVVGPRTWQAIHNWADGLKI